MRDLKYYLYVSDSKLSMLYDQMPEKTRSKLAAELKIDLKVVSATVKKGEAQQNQLSKLRVLSEYLNESEEVGSIEFPGKYFSGCVHMRWGIWGEDWSPPDERIVYFTGQSAGTTVGLGGSPHHLIGPSRNEPVLDSMGGKSNLLRILSALSSDPELSLELKHYPGFERELAAFAVRQSVEKLPGPAQSIEFLAKTLMTEPGVVLGTPLYAALAE